MVSDSRLGGMKAMLIYKGTGDFGVAQMYIEQLLAERKQLVAIAEAIEFLIRISPRKIPSETQIRSYLKAWRGNNDK